MSSQDNQGFQRVQYKRSKNANSNQNSSISRQEQEIKNLQRRIHSPKVDLVERADSYLIRIELPGIDKNTIQVTIKDEQIVLISGSKYDEETLETDNVIYRESKFKDFTRRVKLPSSVQKFKLTDNNALDLNNGILRLSFTKKQTSSTDQISKSMKEINFNDLTNQSQSWADM